MRERHTMDFGWKTRRKKRELNTNEFPKNKSIFLFSAVLRITHPQFNRNFDSNGWIMFKRLNARHRTTNHRLETSTHWKGDVECQCIIIYYYGFIVWLRFAVFLSLVSKRASSNEMQTKAKWNYFFSFFRVVFFFFLLAKNEFAAHSIVHSFTLASLTEPRRITFHFSLFRTKHEMMFISCSN